MLKIEGLKLAPGESEETPAEETPAQDAPAGDGAETPDHE